MLCIFCDIGGPRLICIECIFQNETNTIAEDILELCGPQIKKYLQNTDAVCTPCMIAIEKAVTLKRHILRYIMRKAFRTKYYDEKPVKLSKVLDTYFLRNGDTVSMIEGKFSVSPQDVQFFGIKSPSVERESPLNLLVVKKSENYDPEIEGLINEHYKGRTSRCVTPYPAASNTEDEEVCSLLQKKPRKTRKRRRSTKKSRAASKAKNSTPAAPRSDTPMTYTRERSLSRASLRNYSPFSVCSSGRDSVVSVLSATSSVGSTATGFTGISGVSGRASSKRRRRRSISVPPSDRRTRSQGPVDDENAEKQKYEYVCDGKECTNAFETVEELTTHKIEIHKRMALYPCDMCKLKFSSDEDLNSHSQNHYVIQYCFYCSKETYSPKELQQHLSEHLKHNILCLYCDKSFLSESLKESHVYTHHPQKARKKIRNKHIENRIHTMWANDYYY